MNSRNGAARTSKIFTPLYVNLSRKKGVYIM